MKKLSKGFEACNIEPVTIEGIRYDLANLKKSGILNKSVMLIGRDDKWHELSCSVFNVAPDVRSWVNLITTGEIDSADLGIGIIKSEFGTNTEEQLRYNDYMKLEGWFPEYPYFKISMLHRHLKEYGRKSDFSDLKGFLTQIAGRKESIEDFIARSNAQNSNIINKNSNTKIMQEQEENVREDKLLALGLSWIDEEQVYSGHGFTITTVEVDTYDETQWAELIGFIEEAAGEPVPAAETPNSPSAFEKAISDAVPAESAQEYEPTEVIGTYPGHPNSEDDLAGAVAQYRQDHPEPEKPAATKNPVSIEAFGRLTPERITELQGLKEKQEAAVAANPFIAIKDKETLKKAKANKAALLKASTSTEKIDTDAAKYLNAFKRMLSDAITPLAKLTRTAHDKQAKEITRFEDVEKKRIEEEAAAQKKKVQERAKTLTESEFDFNGSVYSIGTVYILPSQLESATDEEFAALVQQGKNIKIALEAAARTAAAVESEKDRRIREMEEELAKLRGTAAPAPEAPQSVEAAAAMIDKFIPPADADAQKQTPAAPKPPAASPVKSAPTPVSAPAGHTAAVNPKYSPAKEFIMSSDENSVLGAFDMSHLAIISREPISAGFITCREFYKFGLRDLSDRIIAILNAPPVEGVKKSEQILQLCENSKK